MQLDDFLSMPGTELLSANKHGYPPLDIGAAIGWQNWQVKVRVVDRVVQKHLVAHQATQF